MLGHQISNDEMEDCPSHVLHVSSAGLLEQYGNTLSTRLEVDLRCHLTSDL